ncbi:MAG: hypothetical protein KC417_17165 [Myxococcales bacterium]|nr:hypothetical protein [Myxococcales bacterium]
MASSYRNRLQLAALVLAASLGANTAFAQDPAAAPAPWEARREANANVDRVVITSTAETQPEGTLFFSDYELFLLQVGYAVHDRIQVALTGIPPFFKNQPYFFDLTAKVNVLRTDHFKLAGFGAFDVFFLTDSQFDTVYGARLGSVGQVCIDIACRHSISIGANMLITNEVSSVVPVTLSAGYVGEVGEHFALLGEVMYTLVADTDVGISGADGFLFNYGVRFYWSAVGIDLALIRPIGGDVGPFVLGAPFISFTYRAL